MFFFFSGHKLCQHQTASHFGQVSGALPAERGGGSHGAVGTAEQSLAERPGRTETEIGTEVVTLLQKRGPNEYFYIMFVLLEGVSLMDFNYSAV